MADNMGGISGALFVFPSDVQSIVTDNGLSRVNLKAGCAWNSIHPGRYGTTVKVEPQRSEAGTLYNVSCTIQIPKQCLDQANIAFCERMSRLGCVMIYRNFNGDLFLVGSDRFPLKCNFEILHPNSPGGFSGYKLAVTGKQLTPQLRVG